ncbi:MAG: radical SAM protein [Candidatus Zixiibacteriota bacterium]|nr:MAG: radical SAM protein [candidate division Zixibacteria bacterium]
MRILLLAPSLNKGRSRFLRMPQLTLGVISALTPPEIEVDVVEEEIEEIDFDKHYDLVGISSMTTSAPRAYQLSAAFRKNGAKVVLGGIHPTVRPEEAIVHCDCVVIGEAEGCWGELIRDFKQNRMKKFYRSFNSDLAEFPIPRLNHNHAPFNVTPIFCSRGCPYNCEFCSVTDMYGKKMRHRRVRDIVKEITTRGSKKFFFLDDNIVGDVKFATELFTALSNLKIRWVGQASITLSKNKALLKLAERSGCAGLFIGLESVSPDNLRELRKAPGSATDYGQAIDMIRGEGIMLHASLVFGFDHDDRSIFEKTLEFLEKNKVPSATFNILTPYPGTALFDRFKREGRLLNENWQDYDHRTVVFRPKNLTPEELAEGFIWLGSNFYSKTSILSRFFYSLHHPLLYLSINWAHRRGFQSKRAESCLSPPAESSPIPYTHHPA